MSSLLAGIKNLFKPKDKSVNTFATIVDASNFNATEVAAVVAELLKEKQTLVIVEILTSLSTAQRLAVLESFDEISGGQNLLEALKELIEDEDVKFFVTSLFHDRDGNAVLWLRDAIETKNVDVVSEIIGIRTSEELGHLCALYDSHFEGRNLLEDLRSLKGDFPDAEFVLSTLFEPQLKQRDLSPEEIADLVEGIQNGDALSKLGAYSNLFLNYPKDVSKVVQKVEFQSIADLIREKTPNDLQRVYLAAAYAGSDPAEFYALLASEALEDPSKVHQLIRVIVPQSETILKAISEKVDAKQKGGNFATKLQTLLQPNSDILKTGLGNLLGGNVQV